MTSSPAPTIMNTASIPSKMKAAVATGFGPVDDNIWVRSDWPSPEWPPPTKKASTNEKLLLLIRVLACALAPGDIRVLSGKTDFVQLPKSGHPYVVGGDVAGIVVAVSKETCSKFRPGDYVVSRFEFPGPHGRLASYCVVEASLTEKCPTSIRPIEACGLTASALVAKKLAEQYVKPGYRILIIGASGGVGSHLLQYCSNKLKDSDDQRGDITAVSTQTDLCHQLGADTVVDYNKKHWWEIPEFQETQFDVVFDLVNGSNWDTGGLSKKAVRPSGYYVALEPGVQGEIEVHGVPDLVKLTFHWLWRLFWTWMHPSLPRWVAPDLLEIREGDISGLLQDVVEGRLRPVLDPSSPFEFTEEGVREAFHLQESCHAHGKVVVAIADS